MSDVELIANNRIILGKNETVSPNEKFKVNAKTAESLLSGTRPAARYPEKEKPVKNFTESKNGGKDEFDRMNEKDLRAYAADNDIEIPEDVSGVKAIRKYLRENLAESDSL